TAPLLTGGQGNIRARCRVHDVIISRREAFLGVAAVAAPFVIRTPGLLMPVRYRPPRRIPRPRLQDIDMRTVQVRRVFRYSPSISEILAKERHRALKAVMGEDFIQKHFPLGLWADHEIIRGLIADHPGAKDAYDREIARAWGRE